MSHNIKHYYFICHIISCTKYIMLHSPTCKSTKFERT